MIYQYAHIITGFEIEFDYPEPARGALEYFSAFGLDLINVSPPECVNRDSSYYTRLTLATLVPLVLIVVGCMAAHAYNVRTQEKDRIPSLAYVFAFLEFVLSGVATVVCKTFVCEEITGLGKVLVEQPTLTCDAHNSANRRFWQAYAGFFVLVYPVGVRSPRRAHLRTCFRFRALSRLLYLGTAAHPCLTLSPEQQDQSHHGEEEADPTSKGQKGC